MIGTSFIKDLNNFELAQGVSLEPFAGVEEIQESFFVSLLSVWGTDVLAVFEKRCSKNH